MFKATISGKVKFEPEYKMINNTLYCNFTVESFKDTDNDTKSLVRCSCNDIAMEKMKKIKKGTIIAGIGNASNVSYEQGIYVFNLMLTYFEIIKEGEKNE